ncbi:MAG: VCBS repeat-containing protein [Planctomycetia bacterium]|nr:VCBS repeat-containing protein [Planctomycetia bacterium]
MSGRAGPVAVIGALMAIGLGLSLWGRKREPAVPRRGPAPAVAPPAAPAQAPPEAPPPSDPPPPPPDDPPEPPPPPPAAARGWRFGDNWLPLLERAPADIRATCGECHAPPAPDVALSADWPRLFAEMRRVLADQRKAPDEKAWADLQEFYVLHSPAAFAELPRAAGPGALRFTKTGLGNPAREEAQVTNVNIADLDRDGKPEILVCDKGSGTVTQLRRSGQEWAETTLGAFEAPGHTATFDADGDGDLDIAVAGLGSVMPSDDLVGYAALLVNRGEKGWERRDLATGQPRIADLQPADVDGDGDMDLVVGAFGWRKTGYVGWLRNDGASWTLVRIADRTGPIHVPVADLDGDGKPDFVALAAQEAESITAWMNRGGTFEGKLLFEARNPMYGSSGIALVDLDRDGDLDILYTNGDALDDPRAAPKPYHGVQWLENRGGLNFEWREIGRCYGPYRAVASDLDGDGDLDVAVAVLFGRWDDPEATGLIWYENDGKMSFTRHDVAAPSHLITLDAGDLDGDGLPELVSGRMAVGYTGARGEPLLLWTSSRPK